jgi:hypothetical protein
VRLRGARDPDIDIEEGAVSIHHVQVVDLPAADARSEVECARVLTLADTQVVVLFGAVV